MSRMPEQKAGGYIISVLLDWMGANQDVEMRSRFVTLTFAMTYTDCHLEKPECRRCVNYGAEVNFL